MQIQTNNLIFLIIGITLFFLTVAGLLLLYIYVYNNKKKQHILEKQQMKKTFETELLQSQLEVQEQTRLYIAEELHDNAGALSSLIKINLNLLSQTADETKKAELLAECKQLTKTLIADLKQLAIGLNTNVIKQQGLVSALQSETERLEKLQLFAVRFSVAGEERNFPDDKQLILYRICQELLHNIVKHAQPTQVDLSITFKNDELRISLTDDGIGFDTGEAAKKIEASGLTNLHHRAGLIGGSLDLDSRPGQGTSCTIHLPYK